MRRFELVEGTSKKFWEVDVEGKSLTVRFGRIGTNGQTQTKSFPTEEKAKSERDKLVREKTSKGYTEVAGDGASPPAAAIEAAPKREPKKPKERPSAPDEPGWIDAGDGYRLALRDGKLACRNAKGQLLASVPKDVKAGPVASGLVEVRDFLASHAKTCVATVETWMQRSLPTPRDVLVAVWPDRAWRGALENAVVAPDDDLSRAGFLRGVDEARGIGIVDLDGETAWLDAKTVVLPHPILLAELDDFRALASELALSQGISQLFRETFRKPEDLPGTAVKEFRNGKFAQLQHALGVAKKHGYRVSGGNALVRVWQAGKIQEARYWIGSEDPTVETWTDELQWVDDRERPIPLLDVHPIAFSEGMRMASTIYAARVIEKEASS